MTPRIQALVAAALLCASSLAGCSTAPAEAIPEPLPEALAWARPAQEGTRNFLGLKTRENDSGSLDALTFDPGARVVRVVENSPAAAAGLQVGDVVLGWGDSDVDDPEALATLLQRTPVGAEIRVRVQRDDTVFEVPVRLRADTAPSVGEVEVLQRIDPARSRAGWVTGRGGAVLVASAEDAPFPLAGVPVGSAVTAVDGEEVLSARALIRALRARPAGSVVRVDFHGSAAERQVAEVELFEAATVVTGAQLPILFNYTHDLVGDTTEFALIDLWFISLFRYIRTGGEREYRVLRWIQFSSGKGELAE